MKRFRCQRARDAYETRFARGVPKHVSIKAHEKIRVLIAARDLQDIGVLGRMVRWHNAPERYGLALDGKWHVLFEWSDAFGAYGIALERC
jgi:plasmid maintenance system killer protein